MFLIKYKRIWYNKNVKYYYSLEGDLMINIAIIEDKKNEADKLIYSIKEYERLQKKNKVSFEINWYENAERFLQSVRNKIVHDIVFFDIELPIQNGMDAAFIFRQLDRQTPIIFVTNLTQYAIKGYQVEAIDYILKPVEYSSVVSPLNKAIEIIQNNKEEILFIKNVKGLIKISSKDLMYIEVNDHKLSYFTINESIFGYGTLSDLELKLRNHSFLRCNRSYLINPRYIKGIENQMVIMKNGDKLKISRSRKKQFMNELTEWLGTGNII